MLRYDSISEVPDKYKRQVEGKILASQRGKVSKYVIHPSQAKNVSEPMKKSKYGANKTEVDGIVFDSKKEARRYMVLKDLENKGIISDLSLQPEYELQPAYADRSGKKIRPIKYIADFKYFDQEHWVVEDAKGYRTKEYLIKKKIFGYKYPEIDFREV